MVVVSVTASRSPVPGSILGQGGLPTVPVRSERRQITLLIYCTYSELKPKAEKR